MENTRNQALSDESPTRNQTNATTQEYKLQTIDASDIQKASGGGRFRQRSRTPQYNTLDGRGTRTTVVGYNDG